MVMEVQVVTYFGLRSGGGLVDIDGNDFPPMRTCHVYKDYLLAWFQLAMYKMSHYPLKRQHTKSQLQSVN